MTSTPCKPFARRTVQSHCRFRRLSRHVGTLGDCVLEPCAQMAVNWGEPGMREGRGPSAVDTCCREPDVCARQHLQDIKWKPADFEKDVQQHVLCWAEDKRSERVSQRIYEVCQGSGSRVAIDTHAPMLHMSCIALGAVRAVGNKLPPPCSWLCYVINNACPSDSQCVQCVCAVLLCSSLRKGASPRRHSNRTARRRATCQPRRAFGSRYTMTITSDAGRSRYFGSCVGSAAVLSISCWLLR